MSMNTCPICETATASGLSSCQVCSYSLEDDLWASRKERDQMRQKAREKWLQLQTMAEIETLEIIEAPEITDLSHENDQQYESAWSQTISEQDACISSKQNIDTNQGTAALDVKSIDAKNLLEKSSNNIATQTNFSNKKDQKPLNSETLFVGISLLSFIGIFIAAAFDYVAISAVLTAVLMLSLSVNIGHIIILIVNSINKNKIKLRDFWIAVLLLVITFLFSMTLSAILLLLFIAILVIKSKQKD